MCELLPISVLAERAGVTPSQLRIWERRYGWPKAQRKPNGYRAYPDWLVADVQRAIGLIHRAQTTMRMLIIDGAPNWPTTTAEKPKARTLDLSNVPEPNKFEARNFRKRLVAAILTRNLGRVKELSMEGAFFNPSERRFACDAVIAAAEQQGLL